MIGSIAFGFKAPANDRVSFHNEGLAVIFRTMKYLVRLMVRITYHPKIITNIFKRAMCLMTTIGTIDNCDDDLRSHLGAKVNSFTMLAQIACRSSTVETFLQRCKL